MSPPRKLLKSLVSTFPVSGDGKTKESSKQSGHQEGKEGSSSKRLKKPQVSPGQLELFATLGFQLIPNKTICSDNLRFYANNTPIAKSFQKLEADSILNGKNSSLFWNESLTAISNVLSLPTLTDSLDLDMNWLSGYAKNLSVNSWFSMTASSVQKPNSFKICCPSSTASLAGYTGLENINPSSKKTYKKKVRHTKSIKPRPNSVLKIRLYPSKELYSVWKRWLAQYRYYYNETISLLRCYDGVEKLSAESLDKYLQRLENTPDWVTSIPGHQRQEACFEAYDAFNRAKKDGGAAKFKSVKATSQAIQFKVGNYKNGTWYCNTTKGLKFNTFGCDVPQQCEYGTELVYRRGKWFGCFPQYREISPTGSYRVIALDPGNRTFLTGFDGENILEIGKGDIGRIQRLCQHLDKLISQSTRVKCRQRRKMRIAANRIRERIQNLIKELHNKAVNLLVNSYKVIFLPTFDTSQMVIKTRKSKKRRINNKSVRQMLTLSHYRFEQHLKQAALKRNVIVVLCNESYTSKTCGNCGHIHHKLGGSKVFKCPHCGVKISRDVNGARNIMLRALQATAFTATHDSIVLSDSSELTDVIVSQV
jgi:putative transposase